MDYLFSYGTLQLPVVQRDVFGKAVAGEPDALVGYRIDTVRITDARVVALSGSDTHKVAVRTGRDTDRVPGTVFALTPQQLAAADAYETDDYQRIAVPLASGRTAWLYASSSDREGSDHP